jgi:hypothetical protein
MSQLFTDMRRRITCTQHAKHHNPVSKNNLNTYLINSATKCGRHLHAQCMNNRSFHDIVKSQTATSDHHMCHT